MSFVRMPVGIELTANAHRVANSLPFLVFAALAYAGLVILLVVLLIHHMQVLEQVRNLIDTANSIARGNRVVRFALNSGPLRHLSRALDEAAVVLANENRSLRAVHRELEHLAVTDRLTGIGNRHQFEQQAEIEAARAKRYGLPASLILFDIDHFKGVNDRFGHQVGDAVLVQLSRRVANRLRDTDCIARWGGEEFAILTSCTPLAGAEVLACKIREIVAADPFDVVGQVTISIGVAQMRLEESANDWIARADELLYEAKRRGRNRVCSMASSDDPSIPRALSWGEQFMVHHQLIDAEHADLFQIANELILAPEHHSRKFVLAQFDRLLEVVQEHFRSEELVLTELRCPAAEFEKHHQLHHGLVAQGRELREKLVQGSAELTDINDFVMRRITLGHILDADLPLFASLMTSATMPVRDAPSPSLRVRIQRAILGQKSQSN